MSDEGHIEVIYGPMFSGKSSELLRKVRRYQHAKKKSLVINYMHDNRYSSEDVMATHDRYFFFYFRQTAKALKTASLNDVKEKAMDYDVVAVDEGQFYPDIVEFCEELADLGIIVLVAALDSTFQRKPFGNIINLLPVAEKVTKLTAVCVYCGNEASFTQRVVESSEVELIGGEESYKPVCRKCFNRGSKKSSECESNSSLTEEK